MIDEDIGINVALINFHYLSCQNSWAWRMYGMLTQSPGPIALFQLTMNEDSYLDINAIRNVKKRIKGTNTEEIRKRARRNSGRRRARKQTAERQKHINWGSDRPQ